MTTSSSKRREHWRRGLLSQAEKCQHALARRALEVVFLSTASIILKVQAKHLDKKDLMNFNATSQMNNTHALIFSLYYNI